MWKDKRWWAGIGLTFLGLTLMPEGPWYRELGALASLSAATLLLGEAQR